MSNLYIFIYKTKNKNTENWTLLYEYSNNIQSSIPLFGTQLFEYSNNLNYLLKLCILKFNLFKDRNKWAIDKRNFYYLDENRIMIFQSYNVSISIIRTNIMFEESLSCLLVIHLNK